MNASNPNFSNVAVLGVCVLAAAACSDPPAASTEQPRGAAGSASEPEAPDAGPPFEPYFEAFEIAVDQSVTVGAFVLDLGTASVEPGRPVLSPFGAVLEGVYADIALDFVAHNVSQTLATPLADLSSDGLLLEAAGKFFHGDVEAISVPGLRDGVGTIGWTIIGDGITPEDLGEAILTLGDARQNQAVVPLSAPAAAVTLADIPLDTRFAMSYRQTTLDVSRARVQYNTRGSNVPLPSGTAWLVLESLLIADPDMSKYGEYWGKQNMFLERPDGVSVAPRSLNEAVYPGDREDLQLSFELAIPVSGSYTLGLTETGMDPLTREIVIH